ncbi:MAG: hypothetical protein KF749_04320 [Bacteroidetes bacterium]|nr:hypothetical protein [Bacteroidota bacterium]MCW5897602.1 hypothetical protein [Bacteroidota bacterium]
MKRFNLFFAALFIVAAVISGCKKDENNPANNNPDNTPDRRGSYVGTLADQAGGGAVTVNVGLAKAMDILPVTGVFRPAAGGSITLSGTYNTVNDSLYATGGGYTFAGRFSGGQISGTCTGPNGTGIFTVAVSTTNSPVKVYTGSFSVSNGDHGPFNMLISGATISGVAFIINQNGSFPFAGTVQGLNVTIVDPARANLVVASGTISGSGTTVSGSTINTSGQANGTWNGTLVQ